MEPFSLTPEILSAIAGVVLSLAFSLIPGLNIKFASLVPEVKRLIMAGLLLVTSGGILGLSCWGILESGISCDQQGLIRLVWMFILAIMANQSVYQITPLPVEVRDAALVAKRLSLLSQPG